jgi:hypothetical protein
MDVLSTFGKFQRLNVHPEHGRAIIPEGTPFLSHRCLVR